MDTTSERVQFTKSLLLVSLSWMHLFARESRVHVHLLSGEHTKYRYKPITSGSPDVYSTIAGLDGPAPRSQLEEYPRPLDAEDPPTGLSLPVIAYLPALAISAVCTRWHSIALASPRLWSRFRLEIAPKEEMTADLDRQKGFISTLQLYLDRSANSPLLIDLQTTIISDVDAPNPSALSVLLDHASRWQTFSVADDYGLGNLEDFFDRSFPILEDLALEGLCTAVVKVDLDFFEHAPKLRAVRTDCFESGSHLPRTQLTSLDVTLPIGLEHCCPSLTVLTLRSSSEMRGRTISLARLQSFTFITTITTGRDYDYECSLEDMFSCFTFPSLRALAIYSNDIYFTWPPDAFSAFISRSSCALTTLSLRFSVISDLNLIAALRLLPSLTDFAFDGLVEAADRNPITPHFISSMHGSTIAPLVPKLRSLSLKLLGTLFDDAALISMVSSRWIPDPATGMDCLRSLVLHFGEREVDEEAYRQLYDLDRKGMQVVISGKSV
ncbi:hypothetical protein BT96DRAFT_1013116 [Gymnopus androsaceus JB14]|uniref:F-box domain-containing protein n=1 Tax=Gymnopus androsaceus JB14 TaxID=1447944 RepID=A0A6A4II94_9AGAR|nr:hypothetical protein BT96DRAFT_1013116 [Gymnopus androsaceus JB14]